MTTAATLGAALEAARGGAFDLIVSDIGLPDGSGLDLMRQLREEHNMRGVAFSGFGMEEDVRKSKEAGFIEHLTKPIDVQKLAAVIEQVAN